MAIGRRHFLLAFLVVVLAAAPVVFARAQGRSPKIGLLMPETPSVEAPRIDALRKGLSEYGYVERKNIGLEIRSADGNYDRLPALAAELVAGKVDVIVVFGTKAISAAMQATATIPIVDPVMGDPVAFGVANTLARPGGNVTGSVQFSPEAGAKRLEFLKQAFPRVTRVAVLINPANAGSSLQLQTMRATAGALKLDLQALEVHDAAELAPAFSTIAQGHFDAIVVPTDSLFRANAVDIANRVAMQKLPSIGSREFAVAGGLMGYGPDANELYRHAAYFVDRILKGAKPDDLPIERATKLDLVINLKAASAAGITIPESMLVRANEVIR
jgi:putative ABC transport system substrate-binding protein